MDFGFNDEFSFENCFDLHVRGRLYHRLQRKKHIKRKKKICHFYKTFPIIYSEKERPCNGRILRYKVGQIDLSRKVPFEWYHIDGMYDKGKIHCGCGICKFGKKFHLPTWRDLKEESRFKSHLNDYNEEINYYKNAS